MGGEDFDHRVMDYFIKLIKKKHKTDISKDSRALQKLRREAERAKRALSSQHQARRPCLPTVLSCAQKRSAEQAAQAIWRRFTGTVSDIHLAGSQDCWDLLEVLRDSRHCFYIG